MSIREGRAMSPRIVSGISRALFDSDLIATRLALFLTEALWSIMLFWPGDTFARPTYSWMGAVAPEPVWALAFGESTPPPAAGGIKAFNGVAWVTATVKRWNGSTWATTTPKRFDGATWQSR